MLYESIAVASTFLLTLFEDSAHFSDLLYLAGKFVIADSAIPLYYIRKNQKVQQSIGGVRRAQALGLPVSFDVNYRAMLWKKERAKKTFDEILPHVNIIIATQSDAVLLLGGEGNPREMLRELKAKYSCDIVVLTLSSEGSMAFDGDEFYKGKAYSLEEQVNRLGAGDAFDAGLLYGYLKPALEHSEGFDLQTGLSYGGVETYCPTKHSNPEQRGYRTTHLWEEGGHITLI